MGELVLNEVEKRGKTVSGKRKGPRGTHKSINE
jgi:hypothetical protein